MGSELQSPISLYFKKRRLAAGNQSWLLLAKERMERSPRHSKSSRQVDWNRLLQQSTVNLAKPPARPVQKRKQSSMLFLIFGLLLLQGIMLFTALLIVSASRSGPGSPDSIAAIEMPSNVESRPVLIEPPAPTPVPQGQPIAPPAIETQPESVATPAPSVPTQSTTLKLRGVEITQGIQVFQEPENPRCHPYPHPYFIFCNNSMPMVAGRHTLVRAYLSCNQSCPAAETIVHLRLLKDGQEQATFSRQISPAALQRVTHLTMDQLRFSLDNSVNFEFFPPPAWLSGHISFELKAVPQGGSEVSLVGSNLTKEFAIRKPLRVAYLPIEYNGMRPPEPGEIDYWMRRMYPVPDVTYYRLPMPDLVWEGEVSKGEILRKLLYTYWLYIQYHPTETPPDQLFGWLPQELYNGGASDPFWCPNCAGPHSSRVAFGGFRPEQDIGGPRILVHEIAHNLGAQHAWSPTAKEDAACFRAEGVNIQVDPDWPYATTPYIQEFGIDLYSNPPVIYPPSFYDMMAYCAQPWISPHTYRKIFDSPFLQAEEMARLALKELQPQGESSNSGTLLVSGIVYPDGTVSRPEIIKLEGDAFGGFTPPGVASPPGDDYCLDVQAKNGMLLAQHCFDVGFLDLESGLATESAPFFFNLSNINTGEVGQVIIRKKETPVATIVPSNYPPEVTLHYPNGGERLNGRQTIQWDAHDADGDLLRYDLLYSPDAGQSWLPLAVQLTGSSYTFETSQITAGAQALIRVIANDGFHTVSDESNGFFSIQAPPENSVSLVGPGKVESGQTFEVAIVAHGVVEPGLFGVQFELDFDPRLVHVTEIRSHSDLDLVVVRSIDNETGKISFAASRQGQVPNLTGEITLATLTLAATAEEGQLFLDVHNLLAGDRSSQPLTISEVRGLAVEVAR
jgi:hypothetical protein